MPKTKYQKQDIIDAAFEIAKNEGLLEITARKIAKSLKGSVAPIYVNFETMDKLIEAVIDKYLQIANQILDSLQDEDYFTRVGKASLIFAREYPVFFKDLVLMPKQTKQAIEVSHNQILEQMQSLQEFKDLTRSELEKLLLQMQIFQLGLSTMVANQQLPKHYDEKKVEDLLLEVGNIFYKHYTKKG